MERILYYQKVFMPITKKILLREANELLLGRKGIDLRSTRTLGDSWIRGFLKRHNVRLRIPEVLDAARAKYTNTEVARIHFERLFPPPPLVRKYP